ncbi:MAG: tRNA (adenosine(37)-N6)-dimethylallyltransferase MiaA [Pseudomonadales bacterium]|nr:tRNA (adenosine(37)-N6)-dimethylallyltransferase MiaA [Pseudomonadales bacterium]
MGPTASGKTHLAVELARLHPFEIISVDSALVYRGMNIGTAKPNQALLNEIPHHLVDIRDPVNAYSAADFREDAIRLVAEIQSRGKTPLLVGGTMLYFKALKDGISNLPAANQSLRNEISKLAGEDGWSKIWSRLNEVDPVSAARIHKNDSQRLQRALEVYEISGRSMTDWQQDKGRPCPFDLLEIAVMPEDRGKLHETIAIRFKRMLEAGFVQEVDTLRQREELHSELASMKAVGYKQIWQHLDGQLQYDEMIEKAIIATRQFAKRQFTWLRSWQSLKQIKAPSTDEALKIIEASSILG